MWLTYQDWYETYITEMMKSGKDLKRKQTIPGLSVMNDITSNEERMAEAAANDNIQHNN